MNTSCPHCSGGIEIDQVTLASLAGHSHFACPACQGEVPVPTLSRPRLNLSTALGRDVTASDPPGHHPHSVATTPRRTNRNFIALGATALLVLGGIAFVLASQKSGRIRNDAQNMRTEIIKNSYFQNLIATGKTTEADLKTVSAIRAHGDGFVGVSRDELTWQDASEIARRAGARILVPGIPESSSGKQITDQLMRDFPEYLGTTVWVAEKDQPRVMDSAGVHAVTTLERPRHAFLQWTPWRTLLFSDFEESSPFGLTKARTWTSALENGLFTLRRTDSGALWLGSNTTGGNFTKIRTRGRISGSGIFAEKAAGAKWGLLFRVSRSGYYAVQIRGDGCWQFLIKKDKRNQTISPWRRADSILPADGFNDVEVVASGDRFTIMVNGTDLGAFQDDRFAKGGHSLLFESGGDAFFEFDHYELLERDE